MTNKIWYLVLIGGFFVGLPVLYLISRLVFYAIFKSYFQAKKEEDK